MRHHYTFTKFSFLMLFICMFGNCKTFADDIQLKDSLDQVLKTTMHDSARIKILSTISEICEKKDILTYASFAKTLCEKAIHDKQKPTYFYLSNLANAINNIGYYYSKQGDQNKALLYYKNALKISSEIKDKKSAAYQLNNIAYIYDNQGDVRKALEYFYKNLKVQEEIKDTTGIGYSLNNIGYVFLNQKDNKKAMDYFSESLKMFESIHYKSGIAMALGNIGLVYSKENNTIKCLEYYNKSLSGFEKTDDKYGATHALGSIGNVYAKLNDDTKALEYLNRCLKNAEAYHIKSQVAYALTCIARILSKNGNIQTAQQYAGRALAINKELGNPLDIQNTATVLKEIYTKQTKYKEAFSMYQLEMQMRDSITNEANKKEAVTKELQYQYEKKSLQEKIEQERKDSRKNILLFVVLSIALIVILSAALYTRQNNFKTRLQRMELEQQQYRAQMNPHFIFNCLNSIQHYIVHNDVIAANKYLSEFASLMRKTLENNQLQTIELQHEISYLKSYLTLEQMRFENKFTYEINCDENLHTSDIQILPMIIQPFVENAIVHGLCYLEKDGKLVITFEKQHNYLVCTIEDNGIGRTASQSLKKQKNITHTSKGMDLIQKRLALVSTISKRKFDAEIIDKIDSEGKATGTLVILKFPIETT